MRNACAKKSAGETIGAFRGRKRLHLVAIGDKKNTARPRAAEKAENAASGCEDTGRRLFGRDKGELREMNKEERAENWFRNIPGEEKIPMEKKMELCGRVTIPIIVICLGIFIAEYALLRFFGGGTLIDRAADFVNEMARAKGRVHYTTIALAGVIMMFPFAILPVTASTLYRRNWLRKQAEKWLSEHAQNEN